MLKRRSIPFLRSNLKKPADANGSSLIPLLTGKGNLEERSVFAALRHDYLALFEGKHKFLINESDKFLFDLSVDPGEKNPIELSEEESFNWQLKTLYAHAESVPG